MIRAKLANGDFLFGIDAENVRRLKEGKPIVVDMSEIGGHDKFILMYGDTMQDIVDELSKATGQDLPPVNFPPPTSRRPQ